MSTNVSGKFTAGVVQASPQFLDLNGGVEKTIALITDASRGGANLVAFPECWIPGMPWWVSLDSAGWCRQFTGRYFDNAMTVDGPEMAAIRASALENNIFVVFGFVERAHGSLYMAQAIISNEGVLIAARRKLRPTHLERSIFGEGDGSDLKVHETRLGNLGALNCWEHIQPLAKQAMFSQHEQIHVASWPSFCRPQGNNFAMSGAGALACSQVYSIEGQCFTLASAAVMSPEIIELLCDKPEKEGAMFPGGGMAYIIGPDGSILNDILPHDEEGIAYAEVDIKQIFYSKALADPVGHYSRPDVLQLAFDPSPKRRVIDIDTRKTPEFVEGRG